jgi:hypothetical protein
LFVATIGTQGRSVRIVRKKKDDRMPPFVVPPLVKWTLVALGGAAMVHWVVREVRRANAELDRARVRVRVADRERRPSLRLDPETGEYRPQ